MLYSNRTTIGKRFIEDIRVECDRRCYRCCSLQVNEYLASKFRPRAIEDGYHEENQSYGLWGKVDTRRIHSDARRFGEAWDIDLIEDVHYN